MWDCRSCMQQNIGWLPKCIRCSNLAPAVRPVSGGKVRSCPCQVTLCRRSEQPEVALAPYLESLLTTAELLIAASPKCARICVGMAHETRQAAVG